MLFIPVDFIFLFYTFTFNYYFQSLKKVFMTKKKNSQNLLNYESICSSISLGKFEMFLKYLFKSLMNAENDTISRDSFYKLFPKFPYFAKKKLYEFFIKKNDEGKKFLNSNDLINNLIKIIYGNKNERIEIFSQFFNRLLIFRPSLLF